MTRIIEKVRQIDNSKYDDLLIVSVSFEPRCLNISENLVEEYKTQKILIIRYFGEDPLKNNHQVKLKQILSSHLKDPKEKIDPIYFDKYDLTKLNEFILNLKTTNPFMERITIDVSTFTKQYLLLLLKLLRVNYPNAIVRLLYTPGYYGIKHSLSWGIKDINYLPYFGNLNIFELPQSILILLLGYESERAYAIWKFVEPDLTVAVIANPPSYHGADIPSRTVNKVILKNHNTIVEEVAALDPICTKDLLNRWYRDNKYKNFMFSIAPLGTKMQTIGLYLFFEENNFTPSAQIVYASPLFYNRKKYSVEHDKRIREFYLPTTN